MGIAQRTIKGIFWVYLSFLAGRLMTLLTTAVLARLLVPDDFGVIGFAVVFFAFVEIFGNIGINDALIYSSDHPEETADTTFVMNVVIGFLQFLAALLLAPALASLFEDPRIVQVVQVMAITFIIDGFGKTHDALMQKELEFRRRFIPELLSAIIKGVVSILLAFAGFGIWALLLGNLVGSLARTISKWWVLRWRPRLRFYAAQARALWGYSVYILLFQILGVALDQADQMLIGILMGQTQLGYYSIAMRIPELIIANFSLLLTRVLFPTYVKLKDDMKALARSLLSTTRYTAFVTVPIGVGLAAVAPELVPVVFGDQWGPTIVLLQVLALMGTVSTLPWSVGDALKAIGRPDIATRLLVVESLYTFPLIILLVSQTNMAVSAAIANLISLSITAVLRLAVATRFLPVTLGDFARIFRSPFIAAAVMFALVTGWRQLVAGGSNILILASSVLVGVVSYSAVLLLLEREELLSAARFLLDIVRGRGRKQTPAEAQTPAE
jgi:PST family polysaccharide transporter